MTTHAHSQTRRSPSLPILVTLAVSAALADAARGDEIEVPTGVPEVSSISVDAPVAGDVAEIRLQLAYDERGKLINGGTCTVDGTPVTVKGRVKSKKSGPVYSVKLKGAGVLAKVIGPLEDGLLAATTYRGPRGKQKGAADADLVLDAAPMATVEFEFADTGSKRLTGSGSVASPYGNDAAGQGALSGKRKGDALKWKLKHGRHVVKFKGDVTGDTATGKLTFKVLPTAGAIENFEYDGTIPDGGGGGGNDGDGNKTAQALTKLGVSTSDTPRQDYSQEAALPEDYAPLGACQTLNARMEMLLVGMERRNSVTGNLDLMEFVVDQPDPINPPDIVPTLVRSFASVENFWASDPGSGQLPYSRRAATAGDIDGDGLQEIVVVYDDGGDLSIDIIEDAEQDHAERTQRLGITTPVSEFNILAVDYDGDAKDELVIALSFESQVDLLFFDDAGESFAKNAHTVTIQRTLADAGMYVQMVGGNLDYDNPHEIAFVVNQYKASSTPVGNCAYYILDDANAGFTQLKIGAVTGVDSSTGAFTAVLADIGVGDFDGDNIDEIVMGGTHTFVSGGSCNGGEGIVVALDDGTQNFAALGAKEGFLSFRRCPANGPWRVRDFHVYAADVDGDGNAEMGVNHIIFEDLVTIDPETSSPFPAFTEIERIPESAFIDAQGDTQAYINDQNVQVVIGDFTSDGAEDIAVYARWQNKIVIWGYDPVRIPSWRESAEIEVTFFDDPHGILLPCDVIPDGATLKFDTATQELVFTEPTVIAVLAAPPCEAALGMATGGCRTSFGTSETQSNATEKELSVSVRSHLGINVDGGFITQTAFNLKATAEVTVGKIDGRSYSTKKTIVFNSGAEDDGVVFSSIPFDVYRYTILSHPDPELVGKEVTISLPRSPITVKVDRKLYNQSTPADAIKIDDSILQHTVGDVSTYPTRGQKNTLLNQFSGLESALVQVDQGSLTKDVSLEVSQERTTGGRLGGSFSLDVETTGATVMAGFGIGVAENSTLKITNGTSTIYQGFVGQIPDFGDFQANAFGFGLFTYLYKDPTSGAEFEVLNYWVE